MPELGAKRALRELRLGSAADPRRGSSAAPAPPGPIAVSRVTGMVSPMRGEPAAARACATTGATSPSRRKMIASVAPHRRAALSAIASKTGWRSVGELVITRRISRGGGLLLERLGQLAVPRLELLEQPHVLDRDHRLVGEGLQQRDLRVGEGPHLGRADR